MWLVKNPLVGWVLMLIAVGLFIRYVPYDWVASADDKRMAAISTATETMLPYDMAHGIGQAVSSAGSCGFEFRKDSAEIVLGTSNFPYRFIEPGGILEGAYNDGFQSGRQSGDGSVSFCAGALAKYGPSGTTLPMLISEGR